MAIKLHKDELSISDKLVRKLVDNDFPAFTDLPLSRLAASGSTNVMYRLGENFLVRLPRLAKGSTSLDKEHRWAAKIGSELPVEVPQIVGMGRPAFGYGERWSIVHWLNGDLPTSCNPDDPANAERSQLAVDLAAVVVALRHADVPTAAVTDPLLRNYRGRTLAEHDKQMRRNIEHCKSINNLDLNLDAALTLWKKALTLPGASETQPDKWYHCDLVAENLLLTNGRLTGVLDFGGLSVGDPTIDLHGAWELFDQPARETFRTHLGVDEPEWLRGRAWALAVAMMTFSYYWTTMPGRIKDRLAMAQSVLSDEIS